MIVVVVGNEGTDMPVIMESKMPEIYGELLRDLEIGPGYIVVHACSAHRNPGELQALVDDARRDSEGAPIFIGIAGMTAALPGALAGDSKMSSPVLAVPLDADGISSCLKMPPGVPVMMTGVGKHGITNAAIASLQIARLKSPRIGEWLDGYIEKNTKKPSYNLVLNAG